MKTDVRVVAATNVKLQEAVQQGKFREDLYYRLSTVPIYIPPLRERGEDVYYLFRKFCIDFAERMKITPIKLTEEAKQLILKYGWPGNVRQLKNVAEQVSILAVDKEVSATELLKIVPDITQSRMPVVSRDASSDSGSGISEREILYKLFFDLKKDMNDLKQFVFDVIKNQQIPFDNIQHQNLGQAMPEGTKTFIPASESMTSPIQFSHQESKPVLIDTSHKFDEHEMVEESLSIADKEKELIIRALKKHRNKRKDAAADLGISERTLYRKIKEYDLED